MLVGERIRFVSGRENAGCGCIRDGGVEGGSLGYKGDDDSSASISGSLSDSKQGEVGEKALSTE